MRPRIRLSDLVAECLLVETETWALVHLACLELEAGIRVYLDSGLEAALLPGYVVVNTRSLLLHAHGDISLESASKEVVTPPHMKPLLEFGEEDWGRLGLYSLAKTLISCIHGDNISREMIMFFRSILNTSLACIPSLPDIIAYLRNKIKVDSSRRIVSSLYYKLEAIKATKAIPAVDPVKMKGTSSVTALRSASKAVQGSKKGTVSCPNLETAVTSDSDTNTESIENFINNNDVFALLDLPGLKLKGRRNPAPEVQPPPLPVKPVESYVPAFLRRIKERPAIQCSLLDSSKAAVAGQIVRVTLLTGHRLEVRVDKTRVKVKEVLALCLERMQVDHHLAELFGLFAEQEGEHLYLEAASLLANHLHNGVVSLHLRLVRVEDYGALPPALQHLYYLQLRQDHLASRDRWLEPDLEAQLGQLAVQAEVPDPHAVRLDPKYFLSRGAAPEVRQAFNAAKRTALTAGREDAQALYCGLMVNSPLYSLYVYGGRENRGEGSRRIQLRLLASRLSVGGQVYAYSQLRQLSYSQSYLQLVVKGDTAPRRYKVYLPANKASHVYHLLLRLKETKKEEEEGGELRAASRTRRSLGLVCNQIVGAAREVGRTMRTPSKRARSLSVEAAGGKRRKLSLDAGKLTGKRRKLSFSSGQDNNKENTIDKTKFTTAAAAATGVSTRQQRAELGGGYRAESGEKARPRVRMGTRLVAKPAAVVETERRILQVRLPRDRLLAEEGEEGLAAGGHGILVTGGSSILHPGDRILALNAVSLEQVSINTFWKILPTFPPNLDLIISRQN